MELADAVNEAIELSREQCAKGDFSAAIRCLAPFASEPEDGYAIKAEMVRVHLVQGDWKSASEVLGDNALVNPSASHTYQDVLMIQMAFVRIATHGDLDDGLQSAHLMWQKYGTEADEIHEDNIKVLLRKSQT